MFGPDYVFAVEVAKTAGFKASAANKHIFSPSTPELQDTEPQTTIQVVDHANLPQANALVLVKSLDTGHQVGQYTTGPDGKTSPIFLDKDLHRITVICPNGSCGNTTKELHIKPFPGTVIIQALANSVDQSYAQVSKNIKIVTKDSNGYPLTKVEILVRTADAAQERWYTTNASGSVSVTLPTDPSIVSAFVKWEPHVYKLASTCDSTGTAKSDATPCIQIDNTVVLTIPRP
jgi:hypothetical protein